MIRGRDLLVRFGSVTALDLPVLEIEDGERLGVCGPNGSGKSTLLRVLAGLQPLTGGTIEGLPPRGKAVLVHQRPCFLRGTARDNVAYALSLHGRARDEADRWLDAVGAGPLAGRRARDLSGGEGRRVAIARALAVRPRMLLLDEPYAALDDDGLASVDETLRAFEGTLVIAAPHLPDGIVTRTVALERS